MPGQPLWASRHVGRLAISDPLARYSSQGVFTIALAFSAEPVCIHAAATHGRVSEQTKWARSQAERCMQYGKTARKMRAQQTKEGGNAADEVVEEVARGVALASDCRRHAVCSAWCSLEVPSLQVFKGSLDFSVASSVGKRCVVPAFWHFWRQEMMRDDSEGVRMSSHRLFDPRDQSARLVSNQQRQFRLSSKAIKKEYQQRRKDMITHYQTFFPRYDSDDRPHDHTHIHMTSS